MNVSNKENSSIFRWITKQFTPKPDRLILNQQYKLLETKFEKIKYERGLTASSLTDLKVIHRIDYIFSRAIIGFTSGLLMYYIFQSQLISGPFFPTFTKEIPIFDDKNYALLVVRCSISGFSEKLVPDILNKTQEKISEKKSSESKVQK